MTTTLERRAQVVALRAEGKSRREIADTLQIGIGGVRYHENKAGILTVKKRRPRARSVLIAATQVGTETFIDRLGKQLANEQARLMAERDQLDAQATQLAQARSALGLN